jgi:hypothetical protein
MFVIHLRGRTKIRSSKPETARPKSETRNQKPRGQNPKPEIRNPKEARSSKLKMSDFEIRISFGFLASDFGFIHAPDGNRTHVSRTSPGVLSQLNYRRIVWTPAQREQTSDDLMISRCRRIQRINIVGLKSEARNQKSEGNQKLEARSPKVWISEFGIPSDFGFNSG